MALLEREITILSPEGSSHFDQRWPIQYDEYDSDPFERLDKAKADRRDYYRRVEVASKNLSIPDPRERSTSPGGQTLLDLVDDGSMVVREKSISDGGPSADSVPRVPEPHTSWRFYTSYDNGEWRRHMVPVFHTEEEVLSTSPSRTGRLRTESSSGDMSSFISGALSPTFGLETSIRRMRINRPSVYEALQNRRRRTFEGSKRIHGPRSPEVILNTSEYLPREEFQRRYEVKDYVPKRRTEYGERVIYPRVRTESASGIESETHRSFSSLSQRPRAEANFEEVTRSVHSPRPAGASSVVEVIPANSKPVNDFGFQEKVIIPTKYKTGKEVEPSRGRLADSGRHVSGAPARSQFSTVDQQRIKKSGSQYDYPKTHPAADERRTAFIQEKVVEPSMHPHHQAHKPQQAYARGYFSRSLDDDSYDAQIGYRDGRVYEREDIDYRQGTNRPREKSRNQEQEVKVVVVKSQQQDRPVPTSRDFDDTRFGEVARHRQERRDEESTQSGWSSRNSSRVDDIASQVRSSTMDTMRQMETQMAHHMKNKCPEAAEMMDSLISGTDGKDVTMEKKEAFAEQVSLWKGGKPVEERMNRETRYRSNDPISGPQDFVAKSSITREGREMQDPRSYINPYAASNVDFGLYRETPYPASDRTDRSMDSRAYYSSASDRQSSAFYPPRGPSPVKQEGARSRQSGHYASEMPDRPYQQKFQREDAERGRATREDAERGRAAREDIERGRAAREDIEWGRAAREDHSRFQIPEKRTETEEKIIIPSKYRQKRDADAFGSGREKAAPREVPGRRTAEERHARSDARSGQFVRESVEAGDEGGFSKFAEFVAQQRGFSGRDELDSFDDGDRSRSVRPLQRAEEVAKTRITPRGEAPTEIRRLGSVHGQAGSGEWEFDMACSEIPDD